MSDTPNSTSENSAGTAAAGTGTAETRPFQAEVRQVLDIVVHSLYKDREIFIRELVSNASDALEKLRHLQLADKDAAGTAAGDAAPLEIRVTTDEKAGTLTIADTGVGLTRAELVENIGTIAHSGTKAFLAALRENGGSNDNLIGQFGVGFFSVFMVAERVEIRTRSWRPDAEALLWTSDGSGAYTITPLDAAAAGSVGRGAAITIFLKPEQKEFAGKERVKNVLLRYSKYVPVPLLLDGEKLNTVAPLWLKNKSEVTADEYKEFYKFQCHAWDEPLDWLHFAADAPLAINALLFFPSSNFEKLGFGRTEAGVSLHCRKVLIDDAPRGLLPEWLRFLRGVVDSADLPLNISRETMQDSALVQKLNHILTKRVIKHLDELSRRSPETYAKFWQEFGHFIKEGIVTDATNREALAPLLRWDSSWKGDTKTESPASSSESPAASAESPESPKQTVSLSDYVSRMKPDQKDIYYLVGPDRDTIEHGPYLEAFRARGLEVLFFYEAADDFVANHLREFNEKKLTAADTADLDLGDAPAPAAGAGEPLPEKRLRSLCEWLKPEAKNVETIAAGTRLVDSPAVALNSDKYLSPTMRRYMQAIGRADAADAPAAGVKLEINPRHPLIHKLDTLRDTDPAFAKLLAAQVVDNALLAAGLLDNPRQMTARIYEILEAAADRKAQ